MKKVIYCYREIPAKGQVWSPIFKIGKADQRVNQEQEDKSDYEFCIEIAKHRIKEQQTAATYGKLELVNVWDISSAKDSTALEHIIHESIVAKGWVREDRIDLDGKKGSTEWFNFFDLANVSKDQHAAKVVDFVTSVIEKELNVSGLNKFSPRTYQAHVKAKTLVAINSGANVIGCELAARFGKTLWALDLFKTLCEENGKQYMVLPAYVLNALSSFEKESRVFEDFKDFVFVNNSKDVDLSKKLIIPVSLHLEADTDKYDWITNLDNAKKVAFIDEADFGAHTESSKAIIDKLGIETKILMTGTAIERAVAGYDVDALIKWSYFDMLLLKDNDHPILDNMNEDERAAAVATCAEIVRPKFYKPVLTDARKIQEGLPELLQTKWSKMLEDVDKAAPLLTMLLKAMFKNEIGSNHNLSSIMLSDVTPAEVTMIFGIFKNKTQHGKFCKVAETALGKDFKVIKVNGDKTTNRKAEKDVKVEVERARREGKKVLIVSKDMASRSFSVSAIDTVFLMYDGGLLSQTVQKVSRALTPGKTFRGESKTEGVIVSLSFDSNRDEIDPIDLYVVNEAERITDGEESLQDSIRRVCRSANIFESDMTGPLLIDVDEYADNLIKRSSLIKEAITKVAEESLTPYMDEFVSYIIANKASKQVKRSASNVNVPIGDVQTAVETRTEGEQDEDESPLTRSADEEKQLIKNILFLIQNITILSDIEGCQSSTIADALTNISKMGLESEVEIEFGIKFNGIVRLIEKNIIPVRLLNTVLEGYAPDALTF